MSVQLLNQNSYRDFRINPVTRPFAFVYIDYMGPWEVVYNTKKRKVWILVRTCLWSRAINLILCQNATVKEFLRAIQLHVFQYGMFEYCGSDQGSQIVAGTHIISSYLDDVETRDYFE